MTDDEQPEPLRYAYKPSVAGAPQGFELTEEGLSFQVGFRSGVWRYGDIVRIRLIYRPVSMLQHRFRTDIRHKDGKTLTIISATWAGILALKPQNDSYRAFVEELHRRVAAERSGVECLAGLHQFAFTAGVVAFAAIMIAIAALAARALAMGEFVGTLFLLAFAAWSGWYLGSWMKRNKPLRYEPEHIPPQVMP